MSKHTPGPWEAHKVRKIGIGNVGRRFDILHPLINEGGEYKGQLGGYHVILAERVELTEANARLIAESPELLRVLEEIIALERSFDGACWVVEKGLGGLIAQAEMIIARAKAQD